MDPHRYTVYAADRSGQSWDAGSFDDPATALRFLDLARRLYGRGTPYDRVHGVWDNENPERGDVESRLEEMVEEWLVSEPQEAR